MAADTPQRRHAAHRYTQLLKGGLAVEWGFGFVDIVMGQAGSKGLAAYVAKYVCKEGEHGRPELAETVAHVDVPSRPVYVSPKLTAVTRCTMRNLRLRRYYWRAPTCRQAGLVDCAYAEDLWSRGIRVEHGRLVRSRGP
jgi:hypothetical protein